MCTQFLETVTGKKMNIWELLFENVFWERSGGGSSSCCCCCCCCCCLLAAAVTYKFSGFHCSVVEGSALVDVQLCHWLISDLIFQETMVTLKHQEQLFQWHGIVFQKNGVLFGSISSMKHYFSLLLSVMEISRTVDIYVTFRDTPEISEFLNPREACQSVSTTSNKMLYLQIIKYSISYCGQVTQFFNRTLILYQTSSYNRAFQTEMYYTFHEWKR